MDDPKFKKLIELAEKGGNDKDLMFLSEIESISEKVDTLKVDIETKIDLISEELKKKLESELVLEINREELKGEKGDSIKGDPGSSYILTEQDKVNIARSIVVPILEKHTETIVEKTETIKEIPIVTENVVEKALPESADQIIYKINKDSTTLIAKERVEGLEDIEKLAKFNAFNPTMGPSFSDLANINRRIDNLPSGGESLTGLDKQIVYFSGDNNPVGNNNFRWLEGELTMVLGTESLTDLVFASVAGKTSEVDGAKGVTLRLLGGNGFNNNGGDLYLQGGIADGGGTNGSIVFGNPIGGNVYWDVLSVMGTPTLAIRDLGGTVALLSDIPAIGGADTQFLFNNAGAEAGANNAIYDVSTRYIGMMTDFGLPTYPFQVGNSTGGSYTAGDPGAPYTIGPINIGFGAYPNDGYTHTYRIYEVMDTPLGVVYSATYLELTFTDNGMGGSSYDVSVTYTGSGTQKAFRVLVQDDYNPYSFGDAVLDTTDSLFIDDNTIWTGTSAVVTPSSRSTTTPFIFVDSLALQGLTGVTINADGFGSSGKNLFLNPNGGWLSIGGAYNNYAGVSLAEFFDMKMLIQSQYPITDGMTHNILSVGVADSPSPYCIVFVQTNAGYLGLQGSRVGQSADPILLNPQGSTVGVGFNANPTALLHVGAGTTSRQPFRINSGSLATGGAILAGGFEFLNDKIYWTITTGPAQKEITLNDSALTSGKVPVATTNGRLTDSTLSVSNLTNIQGTDRKTGLTAAQALATYTVGSSDASFQVSANVLITASTLHSFSVTCSYTDESNTARVLTLNFSQLTGAFVTTLTNALGASAYEGVPVHIRCKASTTIIIASIGTFTTVTYNLEERIIQL